MTVAVSGWSAVSAAGMAAREFSDSILAGLTRLRVPGLDEPVPSDEPVGCVPGFDIRGTLGRKNTRSMDRITALAVLAVGRLLAGEWPAEQESDGDHTGLVLGTSTGSVQSMMDFTRDSFVRDKPYLVDPARFPNAIMNRAAGQSAIWYGLRGPNATVAGGQVAGLFALRYAERLHRYGHARSVLCGAVEELSPQRTWLERHRREDGEPVPLGEGCAVFRLESAEDAGARGRPVLAHLMATAFRVYPSPVEIPTVLADCARSVLKAADASAADVWALAADLTDAQLTGLTQVIGNGPRRITPAAILGDAGAASAAFEVAAALSHAEADRASDGRLALVASVDRDGMAGVAALRLPSASKGGTP
ncbi:MAG TPA: beta-ketoacyl synthase N-terminal-like domain-containing protein [Pseudonocardiaceae bacterium]|nr:beta-ketoacyl synthase N-terminal-like domain-containing protein [Pseudonocardiaceae bacterium]